MKIDIDKLTERELVDLNRRIVERLKFLESMHAHAEMMAFSVGDKVSFAAPGRGQIIGVLVKYNKKTVTILSEEGQKWNVSPHLIEKVPEPPSRSKQSNNVIDIGPKR